MQLTVEAFDGSATMESWLVKVAKYFLLHADSLVLKGLQWTKTQLYCGLVLRLTGNAQLSIVYRDPSHEEDTPERLLKELKFYSYYSGGMSTMMQLFECKQLVGERLQDYAKRLRSFGVERSEAKEIWYVEAFRDGVRNRENSNFLLLQTFKSLWEAVNETVRLCGDYGEGRGVGWQEAVSCYSSAEAEVVSPPEDDDQWWTSLTAAERKAIAAERQAKESQQASVEMSGDSSDYERRVLDVGSFDGSEKLETWLVKISEYILRHVDSAVLDGEQWTKEQLYDGLMTRLTGSA
ncbi:hypothetical protein PHYBOEH_002718 [Phytophthora boehmeriae]|uniref:Retrotransposon gag domain-containing protein n=1 Tax=Phytophthora boehmeriae TaxID=109152 RepID=A0A8T1XCP6_9STRA|nr:hypothetical protein PHYBOEH_002718 [Phytophthora boehmeriae]